MTQFGAKIVPFSEKNEFQNWSRKPLTNRKSDAIILLAHTPPSSRGLGRSPFKAKTGVRISVGVQKASSVWMRFFVLSAGLLDWVIIKSWQVSIAYSHAMIKIAIVCQPSDQLLPPYQTPAAEWSYQVAGRLTADTNVTIFGRKSPTQNASVIIEDSPFAKGKIRFQLIRTLPNAFWSMLRRAWSLFSAESRPLSASRLYYLLYSVQIAQAIRRDVYDLVHIHNLVQFVPIIRFFNPHAQIILHCHDARLTQLDTPQTQVQIEQCDRIFAVTDTVTKQIHERFPATKHYCQTQFHGVDIDQFRPIAPSDRPNDASALYIGGFAHQDGIEEVAQAFSQLGQLYQHLQFTLICPQPSPTTLFDQVQSQFPAELMQRLTFINGATASELAGQIQMATVVINTDAIYAFNIPIVQASASGVPIVAVNQPGTTAIVEDKRSGFLIDQGDAKALTTRISDLLLHANVRRQMGAAGRKRVAQLFSWKKVSRSVLYSYRTLFDVEPHIGATD